MTTAPGNLLDVRRLLLAHLPLDPASVGIVGDTAHISEGDSYHLGRPEQRTYGYSVGESPRDSSGLSSYASALDVGTFKAGAYDLPHMSRWVVAQCVAGAPDTKDLREIIYSPDGRVVKRWDRLGKRSSGDSSHLYHTHFSFFRDSTKAGRDQVPLFRRYLTTIGLLEAPVTEAQMRQLLEMLTNPKEPYAARLLGQLAGLPAVPWVPGSISTGGALYETHGMVKALRDAVTAGNAADLQRDADLRAMLERVQSGGMTPDDFMKALGAKLSAVAETPSA